MIILIMISIALFYILIIASFEYSISVKPAIDEIYKFRCKLVDPKIAEMRRRWDNFIRTGECGDELFDNCGYVFKDIVGSRWTFGALDVTLPVDCPYDEQRADEFCRRRFKTAPFACNSALRLYHRLHPGTC